MNNKPSETNYIDIAQYIKAQEQTIRDINDFHIDEKLRKKECSAVIDGTVQYLWRNGFGEYEIDLLLKEMLAMANVREVAKWIS